VDCQAPVGTRSNLKPPKPALDGLEVLSDLPGDGIFMHDLVPALRAGEGDFQVGLKLPRRDMVQMSARRAGNVSPVVSHTTGLSGRGIAAAPFRATTPGGIVGIGINADPVGPATPPLTPGSRAIAAAAQETLTLWSSAGLLAFRGSADDPLITCCE